MHHSLQILFQPHFNLFCVVLVSTIAGSEMIALHTGGSNITVIPSVVDVAGLNSILTHQLAMAGAF
jgi:uncharacterized protein (UPF0261 family)